MQQNQALPRTRLAGTNSKHMNERGLYPPERGAEVALGRISVIIPAHNEEDYLGATLDALNRQLSPPHEVLVVANGCTDRTIEVAQEKCDRLVTLSQKNLGGARNLGARMASGELLVFLDADTILEPEGLRVIAEEFTESYAGGTLKGRPDSERFAYRLLYLLKNSINRFVTRNGSSGVIICWRKHFTRVGGFDERLELRENSELIRRLKRFGGYKFIDATAATTSMRRYERRGIGHVVWLWVKLWFVSIFGDLRDRKYEPVR